MLSKTIYFFLKHLCRFFVPIFFEKITIINPKSFYAKSPSIIISNHPNTLIDPIVAIIWLAQRHKFLANAGLFAHPISDWLWRQLWCIPIKRKQDNVQHISNDDSFVQCDKFLMGGGNLYIAPEGISYQNRRVREIKKGTARIALSAEAKSNFSLGLVIRPIAINYTRKGFFWSRCTVEAMPEILIKDYQSLFEKDQEAAADAITNKMYDHLREGVIHTDTDEQEALLDRCEAILLGDEMLKNEVSVRQAQRIATQLVTLEKNDAATYKKIQNAVNQYFNHFKNNYLKEIAIVKKYNILWLILGFPIFIIGFLTNFLAFLIVYMLWKKCTPNGYDATVQLVAGVFLFPIFYALQKNGIAPYFDTPYFGILYWLVAMLSGIVGWRYFSYARQFFTKITFSNKVTIAEERATLKEFLEQKLNS
jgi:glycerol-3-phosphate O-acyltransferase / dihydroxyacetone phosphate acyltransferase